MNLNESPLQKTHSVYLIIKVIYKQFADMKKRYESPDVTELYFEFENSLLISGGGSGGDIEDGGDEE